jgi:hypothetical protein
MDGEIKKAIQKFRGNTLEWTHLRDGKIGCAEINLMESGFKHLF